MAQETIDAVRRAEQEAEQTERNAVVQGDKLITEAQQNAKQLVADRTRGAREQAQTALAEARRQGDALVNTAVEEVEQEIVALRKAAKAKEPQAIKLILSELV